MDTKNAEGIPCADSAAGTTTVPAIANPDNPIHAVLSNPQTMDHIFAHVANGGDLVTFCDVRRLRYSDIAAWIVADPARHKRYTDAALMGQEWIKQRILRELMAIGTVDIRGILNDVGGLKDPSEWPEALARSVGGIEIEELFEGKGPERENVGRTKKIRLIDKIKPLELMGREMGMFANKTKLEVTTRLEDLVGGSFEQ